MTWYDADDVRRAAGCHRLRYTDVAACCGGSSPLRVLLAKEKVVVLSTAEAAPGVPWLKTHSVWRINRSDLAGVEGLEPLAALVAEKRLAAVCGVVSRMERRAVRAIRRAGPAGLRTAVLQGWWMKETAVPLKPDEPECLAAYFVDVVYAFVDKDLLAARKPPAAATAV